MLNSGSFEGFIFRSYAISKKYEKEENLTENFELCKDF
jgi:hypothetical protein